MAGCVEGDKSSLIGYCISCSTVLVWSLVGYIVGIGAGSCSINS